jgi:GNAT superfamily N-acetyltransferase
VLVVRAGRPGDEPELLRVFAEAARAAWAHIVSAEALDAYAARVELPWELEGILVAENGEHVVGFARTAPERCELHLLYTEPAAWGNGAGRMLMDAALATLAASGCEEALLWTEERNERPRRVYERYGWTLDGRRRERDVDGSHIAELGYRFELSSGARRS